MTPAVISRCWKHWQFWSTITIMIKKIIMMILTKISWCWRHWQFLLPRSENRADGEWENMAPPAQLPDKQSAHMMIIFIMIMLIRVRTNGRGVTPRHGGVGFLVHYIYDQWFQSIAITFERSLPKYCQTMLWFFTGVVSRITQIENITKNVNFHFLLLVFHQLF